MLYKILPIILLTLISTPSFSQHEDTTSEYLIREKAEKTYGLDDRLVSGLFYKHKHPEANNHPYFLSESWKEGSVFINTLEYKNLLLNYNLVTEEIILYQKFKTNNVQILLNNKIIDSLRLHTYLFINALHMPVKCEKGFYEVIYRGNFNAYKKHSKVFHNDRDAMSPKGTYSKNKEQLYTLFKNGSFIRIKNKGTLLKQFGSRKKAIKQYLRQNNINFKKINREQLINLLQFCDERISN